MQMQSAKNYDNTKQRKRVAILEPTQQHNLKKSNNCDNQKYIYLFIYFVLTDEFKLTFLT